MSPFTRTIDAAYARAYPNQDHSGKRAGWQWFQWSKKYNWGVRVLVWDEHLADLDRQQIEQRRREQRELEWEIAKAGLELVRDALPQATQFIRSKRTVIPGNAEAGIPDREVVTLSFDVTGLAAASERFGKQGRLSNDEPTDNLNLSGAALDAAIERQLARMADTGEAGAAEAAVDDEGGDAGDTETNRGDAPLSP
jgi:hypothetical protein